MTRPAAAPPAAAPPATAVQRGDCAYTPFYCEENCYLLCQRLKERGTEALRDLFVAFVSNPGARVPLWCQRAGRSPAGGAGGAGANTGSASASSSGSNGEVRLQEDMVMWDYHVLVLERTADGGTLVWDLDTTLPCPCPLERYAAAALRHGQLRLRPELWRYYRVVPAAQYLAHFASDRRHMQDAMGRWLQPPPPWPSIIGTSGDEGHTLPRYMTISAGDVAACAEGARSAGGVDDRAGSGGPYGRVLEEAAFLSEFGCALPCSDGP